MALSPDEVRDALVLKLIRADQRVNVLGSELSSTDRTVPILSPIEMSPSGDTSGYTSLAGAAGGAEADGAEASAAKPSDVRLRSPPRRPRERPQNSPPRTPPRMVRRGSPSRLGRWHNLGRCKTRRRPVQFLPLQRPPLIEQPHLPVQLLTHRHTPARQAQGLMPLRHLEPTIAPTHRPVVLHLPFLLDGQHLLELDPGRHATMQIRLRDRLHREADVEVR